MRLLQDINKPGLQPHAPGHVTSSTTLSAIAQAYSQARLRARNHSKIKQSRKRHLAPVLNLPGLEPCPLALRIVEELVSNRDVVLL